MEGKGRAVTLQAIIIVGLFTLLLVFGVTASWAEQHHKRRKKATPTVTATPVARISNPVDGPDPK